MNPVDRSEHKLSIELRLLGYELIIVLGKQDNDEANQNVVTGMISELSEYDEDLEDREPYGFSQRA